MKELDFLIITGQSGAGKTLALKAFEDYGYFCVDNLPPALLLTFCDLCKGSTKKIHNIALGIDIRGGEFFDDLSGSLKALKDQGYSYRILFLEASDEVLVKRFKENRRLHPLSPKGRIIEGIESERQKLATLKVDADIIINTSKTTPGELKHEIARRFVGVGKRDPLMINVVSFGFKQGNPLDADLIFDVRFIDNPYYVDTLRPLSGFDKDVRDYVFKWPETVEFMKKLEDMIEYLIPYYIREGKNQLIIAIGCTGGRHRSVAITNDLASKLKTQGFRVKVEHRDIDKDRGDLFGP